MNKIMVNFIGLRLLLMWATVFGASSAAPKEVVKHKASPYTQTLPDSTVCGTNIMKSRNHDGSVTKIGEFPWLAALEYKNKESGKSAGIRCSGTLINNRYVLTAAHCLKNQEFELTNVWLGEWNITTNPDCYSESLSCADSIQIIQIKQKIPHQFYSSQSGDNDIGLIRLQRDVEYTSYIRPICLPTMNSPYPEFGSKLTIAGWGESDEGEISNVLLKAEVPLLSNDKCSNKLQEEELNGNYLCAGGEFGNDACKGDSGGPLMRMYDDPEPRWYQEGIVAFGAPCGTPGYPAVYTRVSRYIIWIIRQIGKG